MYEDLEQTRQKNTFFVICKISLNLSWAIVVENVDVSLCHWFFIRSISFCKLILIQKKAQEIWKVVKSWIGFREDEMGKLMTMMLSLKQELHWTQLPDLIRKLISREWHSNTVQSYTMDKNKQGKNHPKVGEKT